MNSHEGTGKTPQGTPSGVSVLNEMEAQDYNLLHDFTGYVANKKYLVVLNGLSTIEEWDWIKTYLPNNHNGSRVLVYTQQAEVASCFSDDKYKVSEIQHEGSFAKPLYVFYKEVMVIYPTRHVDAEKLHDKIVYISCKFDLPFISGRDTRNFGCNYEYHHSFTVFV